MVYCGKPSKGCQECRDRKTRCDRATPSCSQCIRAKRTCPGYRSQLDLMFRNESDTVVGKAKAREKKQVKQRSTSPSGTFPPNPLGPTEIPFFEEFFPAPYIPPSRDQHSSSALTQLPSYNMFPTVDQRALAYFQTSSPSWLRGFDFVDDVCSQTNLDEHLLASMSAVGLASFSASAHAPELMVRAQKDYVTALQLTNAALRSPKEVKKDSTLFAVMILSIFETISGSTERSLAAWAEHINGAAALIKLRGPNQFNTNAGKRMFLQVTSSMMLHCIQRCIPLPKHLVEMRKHAERFMDADNPAWRLSGVVTDFTLFRAAVTDWEYESPRAVIDAAMDIERRFTDIFDHMPPDWQYETVYTDENPQYIWNSTYHIYQEHWMAGIWNSMRTCRILLHEMIHIQLQYPQNIFNPMFSEEETATRLQNTVNVMTHMRNDILSSIPQHTPSLINNTPSTLLEGSRTYFVLWPLYLVGAMDLTTPAITNWVVARLMDIGESAGLRQAIVLAEFLQRKQGFAAWDVRSAPLMDVKWTEILPGSESDRIEA